MSKLDSKSCTKKVATVTKLAVQALERYGEPTVTATICLACIESRSMEAVSEGSVFCCSPLAKFSSVFLPMSTPTVPPSSRTPSTTVPPWAFAKAQSVLIASFCSLKLVLNSRRCPSPSLMSRLASSDVILELVGRRPASTIRLPALARRGRLRRCLLAAAS